MTSVSKKLRELLAHHIDDVSVLSGDDAAISLQSLAITSFDMLHLVFDIEEEWNIEVETSAIADFVTLQDVVCAVEVARQANRQEASPTAAIAP